MADTPDSGFWSALYQAQLANYETELGNNYLSVYSRSPTNNRQTRLKNT